MQSARERSTAGRCKGRGETKDRQPNCNEGMSRGNWAERDIEYSITAHLSTWRALPKKCSTSRREENRRVEAR